MESNWRWNVAAYGMVGSGLLRLARSLELSDYLWGQPIARDAGGLALFYCPLPEELPVFVGWFDFGTLHFPCGQLVEPD